MVYTYRPQVDVKCYRVMKSRKLRWVRHAARNGAKRNWYRNFGGKIHNEEKSLKGYVNIRITLMLILKN